VEFSGLFFQRLDFDMGLVSSGVMMGIGGKHTTEALPHKGEVTARVPCGHLKRPTNARVPRS
jgi:hypothetical protein